MATAFSPKRRVFLKTLLAFFVVVGLGKGLLWNRFRARPPALGFKPQHLSPVAVVVLLASWRAILTAEQRQGFALDEEAFLKKADSLMGMSPDYLQADFDLAMKVLNWLPLIRLKFSPFAALSPQEGRDVLQGLATGRNETLRLLEEAPRKLVYFIYYTQPTAWGVLGYDGPWAPRKPGGFSP